MESKLRCRICDICKRLADELSHSDASRHLILVYYRILRDLLKEAGVKELRTFSGMHIHLYNICPLLYSVYKDLTRNQFKNIYWAVCNVLIDEIDENSMYEEMMDIFI